MRNNMGDGATEISFTVLTCEQCGTKARVSDDSKRWACGGCQRIQAVITPVYRVAWINIGHWSDEVFPNAVAALRYAKSKGFEALIAEYPAGSNPYRLAGKTVMTWGPISGVRLAENICGVKL